MNRVLTLFSLTVLATLIGISIRATDRISIAPPPGAGAQDLLLRRA